MAIRVENTAELSDVNHHDIIAELQIYMLERQQ